MSPEQAQGAETGPASDVFSLGAVLAFAATGEGPFGNASMHVLLYRVVHEPARLDHIADAGLRDLVAACLEKGPERRPAPGELLQWLAPRAPRTATLQGTDWLPGPIAADVARHTDQAVPARTVASPVPPGPAAPPGFPPGAAPGFTSGSTPGSAPGGLDRRRLLVLGGAGAAVLAVGGGVAVAMAGSGDGSRNGSGAGASASPAARPTATSASAPPPTLVGRVRWKHDTGGYLVSDPTVSDGVVYIGAEKADLLALDATTGKPRWRHRIARPNEDVSAAPAVAGGVVYAGSPDGDLHALDARTGRQRWRYGAGTQVASAPVVVGGTVYVASQQGNIFRGLKGGYLTALSAATGAVKWRSRTKAAINSGFVVAGGVIYLPDDSLVALDAGTGRVKWTYKNKGIHSPVLAGGVVYCGNFLGEELHAVDAATGRRRWSYRTGSSITARPLVMGGKVFVGDSDGNMYALDAATGSLRWQLQTNGRIESNAALAGGLVCFASGAFSKGRVYAVDPAGGHAVWRYETDEGIESSPAVAPDGTVYVSCKNGSIYALDIKGGTETAPPLTN
jgi:outer membrane protein assembly factor BamB